MGATVVLSAVTVGRIAAVLGKPGKMIQELDGEIASPVIQRLIMFLDALSLA